MDEIKIEDIKAVKSLENHILAMFDTLRSESLSSEEYHVILLLISLYKDDIITSNPHLNNLQQLLNLRYIIEIAPKAQQYLPVYEVFESTLKHFSPDGFIRLVHIISSIDKKILLELFPQIFDNILYRISESMGRHGGESIQPLELTRFICKLANLPEKAKVFNPFAGLASFAVYLDHTQDYFGQELNNKTWALGALRLMAYGKAQSFRYVQDDSILHWPEQSEKFDLVVSNPPYTNRLGQQYRDIEPSIRTIEQFLIEKGANSLNATGKLIALLPQGFLFRLEERRLREQIIEQDLIDYIISLPGGLLLNTGIPLIILVLNKDKKTNGHVRFIDAKTFVEVRSSRSKILKYNELFHIVQGANQDSDVVRIVQNNKIKTFDYNLSVPRYFESHIKHVNGIKLRDILEFVPGRRVGSPVSGKLIRIKDLKDDQIDFKLDVSAVDQSDVQRAQLRLIQESSLLLASRWKTLKPTFFEFMGTPVLLNQDISSFRVNEKIVDVAYLVNELHSDYVQEQLESYRLGSTVPMLRREDLLEVVINLPSKEEQRAKVRGIVELSDKIKQLQEERNALAQGVSNKLYESVSTIKHSLGKPLLNIGSSLRNIEKALDKLNSEWKTVKLTDRYEVTIKETFNSIYSNLELIHSILKNNVSHLDVTNYELEEIEIVNFIKTYVNKVKSSEKENVDTSLDLHPDIELQLNNEIILKANPELLEIALNTIVDNANRHAFVDSSKEYKLVFRLSIYVASNVKVKSRDSIGRFNTYVKIEVANNGKLFPDNFSLGKLVRKNAIAGDTGNTGQGGFDLDEIIKYHNNGISTLDLITDDLSSEFTTTYSFLIPFNR